MDPGMSRPYPRLLPTPNAPNALPPLLMSHLGPSRISKLENPFLFSLISNCFRRLCGLVELVSLSSVLTEPALSALVLLMYNSPPRRRHPPLFLVEDRHSVLRSYCACIYLTSTMTTRLALFSPPPRTIPRLSSLPLPRHAANESRTETSFFGVPCSSYMIPISPFAITSRTTNPRSSTTKRHSNPPPISQFFPHRLHP